MGIVSFVIVLVRAPICSVRRPIKDNKKKLQYKFTAALSVASVVYTFYGSFLFLGEPEIPECIKGE